MFVAGCVAVLLLHLFGTMSLWIKFWARRSPAQVFKDMRAVLITAFSTSSSNATLPAALACAKDTLKLQPSVAGFVLPLGTTMNMSGTALYEGCVVLFVAQVFGVDLNIGQQITLLLLSVLSAVAVAGIPGARCRSSPGCSRRLAFRRRASHRARRGSHPRRPHDDEVGSDLDQIVVAGSETRANRRPAARSCMTADPPTEGPSDIRKSPNQDRRRPIRIFTDKACIRKRGAANHVKLGHHSPRSKCSPTESFSSST